MASKDDWSKPLYFGCWKQTGHYPRAVEGGISLRHPIAKFDGLLVHGNTLAVWHGPQGSFLVWPDNTVDKRGGSNAIYFNPNPTLNRNELLEQLAKDFPMIADRIPKRLVREG